MGVTNRELEPELAGKLLSVNYRRVLANLPVAAYACDAEGLITYFNECAAQLWGREPTLNDVVDRFCGSFKLFAPDGSPLPHDQCWMALALRDRRGYNGLEVVIERPDGSRWMALAHANPFLDEQGQLLGAANVLVDISDRRRAETARAHLSAIVDSSEDATISKDLNGFIQSWNAAAERLFGYTAEEAVGRHISFLIPAERAEEEDEILARLRAGERVSHFDTVRLRSDGQRVHVSLTISPIRDQADRIIGASKIVRDITDRKLAEVRTYGLLTELKEADSRKDEFLAMLAHELRTPLAPLRDMIEITKRGGDHGNLPDEVRATLERQVGQMARLVDDLLDVSRITQRRLDLRKERITLASVINHAVETCRPLADSAKHELSVSLPSDPIYLDADPTRMVQVFSNLLNNACKYTEPGGRIWVTVVRQGGNAVVNVKDTGVGIPPDKIGSIFEMFTQADRSLGGSQGGLGIGLSLVKWLVDMHGGTVAAHSDPQGGGSEFVVRLPMAGAESKSETRPAEYASRTSYRILVVDDNRDAAASLVRLLRLIGHETHAAHDGVEAIEVAATARPDVILLDLGLPKLHGYDVCRRIREQPWGNQMLVVALTGWGQDDDRRRSKEAGFDHHMVKPLDLGALTKLLSAR